MKILLCRCVVLGIVGVFLFIGIATMQGNPITMWAAGTWLAFILMILGFVSCAILNRNNCSKS